MNFNIEIKKIVQAVKVNQAMKVVKALKKDQKTIDPSSENNKV